MAVPVALSAALAGLALLVVLKWSVLMAFDRAVVTRLNQVDGHSAWFVDLMRAVSAIASTAGWLIVLGSVALWLLIRRRWWVAVFVAVTAVGSPVLNAGLKDIVRRPRPVLVHPVATAAGWSFPSGHTQAATVGCAILLAVFVPGLSRIAARWAIAAAVAVVAVVALSRMSLGVHYPSDVAASVLCGLAWTWFIARLVLPTEPSTPPSVEHTRTPSPPNRGALRDKGQDENRP